MTKIETTLEELKELDFNYMVGEVNLYLDNNYGKKCMDLFTYINTPKEDFSEEYPYKKLTPEEARELKWYYIKAVEDFLAWYLPVEASRATIVKACKSVDFFQKFNSYFISSQNGEVENIETFKRVIY